MPRAILATLLAAATVLSAGPAIALGVPVERARVIVVLRDGPADPGTVAADIGRANAFAPELVYRHAIRGFAASVPVGRLAALRMDPRVASVEPDGVATIAAQELPTGIRRIEATANTSLDIDGVDDLRVNVDVAVIDTGIDSTHPDLNVVAGVNCTGGGPFGSGSCTNGQSDGNGHGTHVAGTIGALDNGVGVVGVAPGARLWAVKVLGNSGSGYWSWILAGVDYVNANAGSIEVANMSLGCADCADSATSTAISNTVAAGVTFVVAAGNSDMDTSRFFPANLNSVIAVSALADFDGRTGAQGSPTCRTDQDDTLADFSNWGSTVDIAAPGVCITSTWPGGYNTISGTSMASPHVAGAAALLKSADRSMTRTQVLNALTSAGTLDWTDDSGDGTKERLLDVRTLTASMTGPGGGGGVTTPDWIAIGDLDASRTLQRNGWTARFTTLVVDSNGSVVSGAVVAGTIQPAGGSTTNVSCTTGAAGTCTVSLSKISLNAASATFAVTGITGGPAAYAAANNTDPDGGETRPTSSSITVSR